MRKMFALVIAACLVSVHARADVPMTNVYKGCVIASIGTPDESLMDEKYCTRLRQTILGQSDDASDQYKFCSSVALVAWMGNNDKRDRNGFVPRAVRKRILVGCLMMIKGTSEDEASRAYEQANPKE